MKKLILLTFLFTLLLIPTTHAQLPFIVQVVYFKPVGAPPAPGTVAEVMARRADALPNRNGTQWLRCENIPIGNR